MYVWIVSIYEPMPIGGDDVRPMRNAMLSQALADCGHAVELWIPGFEHVHHRHFRSESVREQIAPRFHAQYIKGCGYSHDRSPRRLVHNRMVANEFLRLASSRETRPDAIVTQIPSLELADAVRQFAAKNGIPMVVDIRDLWPDVYKSLLPHALSFLYSVVFYREIARAKRVLKNAAGITAVTKGYLNWGLDHAGHNRRPTDRVFYIGYPSDPLAVNKREGEQLVSQFDVPGGAMIVFFAGAFCSIYDFKVMIRAAQQLQERSETGVHLVVAGRGEGDEVFRKTVDTMSNISYVGWLDAKSLRAFMSTASVGLVPYTADAPMALPNKLFGYMSASLPVLCSSGGEMADLIQTHRIGLSYQAGDSVSLANALIELNGSPDARIAMGARGRTLYEKQFSADVVYSEFVRHIESVRDSQENTKCS